MYSGSCIHSVGITFDGSIDCRLGAPSDDCYCCPYYESEDDYFGNKADFDYDFYIDFH